MPRLSNSLRYEFDKHGMPVTYLDVINFPLNNEKESYIIIGFDAMHLGGASEWVLYCRVLPAFLSEARVYRGVYEYELEETEKWCEENQVRNLLLPFVQRIPGISIPELLIHPNDKVRRTAKKFIRKYPCLKHREDLFTEINNKAV